MTRRMPIAAVIVIGIIALAGLLFFARSPVLYSPENASAETKYHVNTGPLMAQPVNSTTDIYPLMQDLLNRPGSITLEIRLRDPDSAMADLAAYEKTFGRLDNLVINLDMNESEIENFTMSSQAQDEILRQLANDTVDLDALKDLQIRYRSSQDPDMMVAVNYQGAALKKRLGELYGRYMNEHQKVLPVSAKLGLDTTQYNQSTVEFQRLISETDAFVTAPARPGNLTGGPYLSLGIQPDHVVYRDTVRVLGHLVSPENPDSIAVLVDGNPVNNFTPDQNGEYTGSFTVERLPAGNHTLVAEAANITSSPAVLTVNPVDSTTTLAAVPGPGQAAAICSGTVLANRPVRFAPFMVRENNRTLFSGTTDDGGKFNVSVPLFPGTHVLVARFDSPDYPVNASESDPVTVSIPLSAVLSSPRKTSDPFVLVTAVAVVLAVSLGGSYTYLRRKNVFGTVVAGPAGAPAAGSDLTAPPGPGRRPEAIAPGTLPAGETVLSCYEQAREAQGISEAAYLAYRLLSGRIAGLRHIVRHLTRTPREIVHACRDAAYGTAFTRFVSAYEQIRYGGGRSAGEQAEFTESLVQADQTTGGGRD
jgi:hypothetical protein